jgi:hypothetical protein
LGGLVKLSYVFLIFLIPLVHNIRIVAKKTIMKIFFNKVKFQYLLPALRISVKTYYFFTSLLSARLAGLMKSARSISLGKIKSKLKVPVLRACLWVGACVVLIVVITVPVCQFINTIHAINLPADPAKSVPAAGLLSFFMEKPDESPLNAAPAPASPGTPAKPRPAAVTHSSPNGGVPAKGSLAEAGPEPQTLVVTYTDYVTYYFNPPVIDKTEVDGYESFCVYISANVTIVKDIPFSINSANLTLDIFATDATGSINIPLTISGNSVSFCVPDAKDKSTTFSQRVILRFPENTPGFRYHLRMNIRNLAVSTGLGNFHISFGRPDEMYDLGYIGYGVSK